MSNVNVIQNSDTKDRVMKSLNFISFFYHKLNKEKMLLFNAYIILMRKQRCKIFFDFDCNKNHDEN